jgi:hypothetical protein
MTQEDWKEIQENFGECDNIGSCKYFGHGCNGANGMRCFEWCPKNLKKEEILLF